jgi:hypothetical protein
MDFARSLLAGAAIVGALLAGRLDAADIGKEEPKVLACAPAKIGAGDAQPIDFGLKHGRDFSIRRPSDGKWFFLVVQVTPADRKDGLPRDDLASARRVALGNGKIFATPGKYSFHLTEILESERGGYVCMVTYE